MGSLRGCTCLKCTNKAKKAPMKQEVQQQSRLVHLRQVHPLKAASVKICAICGRIYSKKIL